MLVKSQSRTYSEDYGLLVKGERPHVHMFENGIVRLDAHKFQPVVQVNARWMDKHVKVACSVADTEVKKRQGLQGCSILGQKEGMYFPYPGYSDVTFHQGEVPFSLDLIFIRDGIIIQRERDTKVGSNERWSCEGCDGVIEVNGGFCEEYEVDDGDRLVLFAFSQPDIAAYEADRHAIREERLYRERAGSLLRAIVSGDADD